MPLPAILAGLVAVGAAAVGIGAHASAKETNEIAESIANDAQNLYNSAKSSLEKAQGETEQSLLNLGNSKKKVLETSISQFLISYERIKNIEISDSVGLDEIKNFALEKQDAIQLREMSNIYQSAFSSGVAGAATGAVIALAASGSLPIVTGTLSIAGSALAAGEIGVAAGLAGSALSFGAAMTPLAAIAAPVVLFSGISASIKADENLEKANTMYAEAEVASEKMKTAEALCAAIAERADMYDGLLDELNGMFSYCTGILDDITRTKMGMFKNKTVDARTFTEDELKLAAVTRALAGAVKTVIDTPILTREGEVSSESEVVFEDTVRQLPAFTEAVDEVKSTNYSAKAIVAAAPKTQKAENPVLISDGIRIVLAIYVGIFMPPFMEGMIADTFVVGLLAFATATLLIMNNDVESGIFKLVKNICCISISTAFCFLFYNNCQTIVDMNHYIIGSIIIGFASMVICAECIPSEGEKSGKFKRTMARIFGCVFAFAIAILVYAFLYKFIAISHKLSVGITMVAYAFFAFAFAHAGD